MFFDKKLQALVNLSSQVFIHGAYSFYSGANFISKIFALRYIVV
jgi:hypothetical protein